MLPAGVATFNMGVTLRVFDSTEAGSPPVTNNNVRVAVSPGDCGF
jgi:hypothetical protein